MDSDSLGVLRVGFLGDLCVKALKRKIAKKNREDRQALLFETCRVDSTYSYEGETPALR